MNEEDVVLMSSRGSWLVNNRTPACFSSYLDQEVRINACWCLMSVGIQSRVTAERFRDTSIKIREVAWSLQHNALGNLFFSSLARFADPWAYLRSCSGKIPGFTSPDCSRSPNRVKTECGPHLSTDWIKTWLTVKKKELSKKKNVHEMQCSWVIDSTVIQRVSLLPHTSLSPWLYPDWVLARLFSFTPPSPCGFATQNSPQV